jgi:hypothetical protein
LLPTRAKYGPSLSVTDAPTNPTDPTKIQPTQPQVRYIREGSDDDDLFLQLLLDEPDSPGGAADPSQQLTGSGAEQQRQFGLHQFLEHIKGEVLLNLAAAWEGAS